MSNICHILTFVFLLTLNHVSMVQGQSKNTAKLLKFLSVVIGYSEGWTFNLKSQRFEPIKKSVVPVHVPAFGDALAFYLVEKELYYDIERKIFVLSERQDGFIIATPYNFTGSNDPNLRNDDLSIFQNMTEADFSTLPGAEIVTTEVDEGVYLSNWPETTTATPYFQPAYSVVWTCSSSGSIFYSNNILNNPTILPGIARKLKWYPLLPSMLENMQDFVDPCKPKCF